MKYFHMTPTQFISAEKEVIGEYSGTSRAFNCIMFAVKSRVQMQRKTEQK